MFSHDHHSDADADDSVSNSNRDSDHTSNNPPTNNTPHMTSHVGDEREKGQLRRLDSLEMKLYTRPPPQDDCPICMLPMPMDYGCETDYMSCCGKIMCAGCRYYLPRHYCPFCNVPVYKDIKEMIERNNIRMEKYNDPMATYRLACFHDTGTHGFPLDRVKAVELFRRAGELGSAGAHHRLGLMYARGEPVGKDMKKSVYHMKQAAMMGNSEARFYLGCTEGNDGHIDIAMKHFMIGACDAAAEIGRDRCSV
eukprot:scaffold146532_cov45-Cyclotella_meneghiniana.AAC.1